MSVCMHKENIVVKFEIFSVLDPKETIFMNGLQQLWDQNPQSMKEECFFLILASQQTIHSDHQGLDLKLLYEIKKTCDQL